MNLKDVYPSPLFIVDPIDQQIRLDKKTKIAFSSFCANPSYIRKISVLLTDA